MITFRFSNSIRLVSFSIVCEYTKVDDNEASKEQLRRSMLGKMSKLVCFDPSKGSLGVYVHRVELLERESGIFEAIPFESVSFFVLYTSSISFLVQKLDYRDGGYCRRKSPDSS